MKEKKLRTIQKSIRMTEETYEFIKGFSGKDSLADDLHELVHFFKHGEASIDKIKLEVEELEKQKQCLYQEVNELMHKIDKVHQIENTIKEFCKKVGEL